MIAARPPSTVEAPRVSIPAFLQGGGEMGALIRLHDWGSTPLGTPEHWPSPLKTALGVILNTGHPMYIWWGREHFCFYNDAYRQSIGVERHPCSLGQPGRKVWEEIWDIIGPEVDQVMSGGGATWHENSLVPITRNGRREDVYWTYSYSPILDSACASGVGGVLVVCAETTSHVTAARRAVDDRERFTQLFDQAPSFMAILRGPEHRFELTNPAYQRLIGHRDVIGRTVAEALPEAATRGYIELLDKVYASGAPYTASGAKYPVQPTPADPADERFVDFVYQPIKDTVGNITGIFVEGVDVTRRTLSDAARLNSEEQLRLATDAAEVGLWDVDVGSGTLFWPPRVKAMFGISGDEPVSLNVDFYPCLHPEDRDRVTLAFAAALDPTRRALYDVEYRTIGKQDGLVRWVAAKGRGVYAGDRCLRVIGTAIDITARKAAEAELKILNERLEQRVAETLAEKKIFVAIIESTDAHLQAIDRDFRIIAINKALADDVENLYGVRPKVGDYLPALREDMPAEQQILVKMWRRALAGEEFTAVHGLHAPHHPPRHFEIKFNPLRNAQGEVVGAFHFAYDVTARLHDQARLAEAEAQIRQAQKIEALGQLTGGVAHDFNNLLMVMKGGISLLKRPFIEPERRQKLLLGMEQATDRGATLSRQLLAFARRQPLKAESVDLCLQIEGMRELLDRSLRGDVQVRTEFADGLWPVEVDPAELEFVILNLCVNARDAMPSGGIITIMAKNRPEVRQPSLSGDFVALSVVDPGTGMPPEVLAHVFEPFYTTKEIGKGSGLGLAQVHGFAQQSGGTVEIDSALGRGTTVTLLLPRTEAAPAAVAPGIDIDSTIRRRALMGSILLVEDDNEVAALVTEMLQELGYRITRAASAQAALGALANDRNIDLVFSDVMMPGDMDGIKLAGELMRRRPNLPVLLTTGYSSGGLSQAGGKDVHVLHKPYDIQTLDAALRTALGKPSSSIER